MFKKAQRIQAKLKIGLSGPSGSGKTFSALRLANGISNKIAVIDSERKSASLYSDRFDFDVVDLEPPYTTEKYIEAIKAACKAGYEVLIIDSISHAWSGEGGILNQKEQLDARGGNSFTNWAKMTPKQERFVSAILHAPIHIICTLRSKQEYIIEQNDKGKQAPRKVGLAPVQREGFEYELTTMFDIAMNHEAETSKDRTGLFVDKITQISEETGKAFVEWLNAGAKPNEEHEKAAQKFFEENIQNKENNDHAKANTNAVVPKPNYKKDPPAKTEAITEPPALNTDEPLSPADEAQDKKQPPEKTAAPLPNNALGVYVMKGGKYNGTTLNKIKKEELIKYVTDCQKYQQDHNTKLPPEVEENIFYIKGYIGIA